ncbi:MAG TPA: M15 family metallopeptidase [Candidatus Eisenbacteria bacterium]|nr:M15 family metallopeptidase [Candidatus Eisenbacteria bacterium]
MEVLVRRQRRRSPGHAGFRSRFWLALPVLWLALALGSVAPVSAEPEPLPACRNDDLPAAAVDYADWQTTLVDTIFMVPSSYVPPDLAPVSQAGMAGGGSVRKLLVNDLARLAADADAAGATLAVESAYRSYDSQVSTFQHWVDVVGYDSALRVSARPGHSEHQVGTAVDFKSAGGPAPWELSDWATTVAGAWMAANAWRYGFVLSYPKGAFDTVCYDYEPWHYRYFGPEVAAKIHDSGQTPREYLWAIATGAASPSPSPSLATAAPRSEAPGVSGPPPTPTAAATAAPGSPGSSAGGPGALVVPALAVIALGILALGLLASRRARRGPPDHRIRTRG